MVEHQSCASLVNASALCAIEHDMKIDGTSSVAEILAELQREKQRNAELMERISVLEAQIQERNKESLPADGQINKFKRQRVEATTDGSGDGNNIKREDGLVNWMSMETTQFQQLEKLKDGDSIVECDDTDESDDEDCSLYKDDDLSIDRKDKVHEHTDEQKFGDGMQMQLVSSSSIQNTNTLLCESQDKEIKSISQNRKPPKVAFCPKEVKRIMESEELLQKNAQSHTIRKIIVFASLGIRHGCEDMYELDLNHFSILSKGEPYVSSKKPGEHVLYESPGGRRKIFYPNKQNKTLCPVRVLEEEKDMRPSDASCPSCLFLCIKYGGRTRNLPQNEYVRQRMGRNKLKSFGPVMCRMAMLVNVRNGSFFFKALGITLLFMAGFPDDLVQRETKYRSLDLLQKYYRRDEDAEGEELFLSRLVNDTAKVGPQQLRAKTNSTKPKGKKQAHLTSKPQSLPKPLTQHSQHSTPSSSTHPTQFGLMSYNSIQIQNHAMSAFQSMPPQARPNSMITSNQNPYHMFPLQPTNAMMPMMFWPPPKPYPPCPYPSFYGFQSLPSAKNYVTFHQQPYYSHSLVPQVVEGSGKNDVAQEGSDGDSNSSSSSSEQRLPEASCKQ